MYKCVCREFAVYTCLYTVQTNMYSMGLSDRYHKKKRKLISRVCRSGYFFVLHHLKVFSLQQLCYNVHLCV